MDMPADNLDLSPGKFAVGQPVSRKEDPTLLRGEGAIATTSICRASSTR